jgi:excisionase family DNA binding protein
VIAEPANPRFLTIEQAAEELKCKARLIRGLIKNGELRAIQVGAAGRWRIGLQDFEDYIAEAYRRTAERIATGELKDEKDGNEVG